MITYLSNLRLVVLTRHQSNFNNSIAVKHASKLTIYIKFMFFTCEKKERTYLFINVLNISFALAFNWHVSFTCQRNITCESWWTKWMLDFIPFEMFIPLSLRLYSLFSPFLALFNKKPKAKSRLDFISNHIHVNFNLSL